MFWQAAALVLVATLAVGGLMVLRAVLARAAAIAPQPAAPPPNPTTLAEGLEDLRTVRAEWRAYQKHLDSYLEAFEDIEQTIEHKRRRTAAAASKVKPDEPDEPDDTKAGWLARARAQGLPV